MEASLCLGYLAVGSISLSIGAVWLASLVLWCLGKFPDGVRFHMLIVCLLAPFNMHVLYLGVVHGRLV